METEEINVSIGDICVGPARPVLIQSMCNTRTTDTRESVDQCIRIFEAGGGLSRLAARNISEARNLGNIRRELIRRGFSQPLCADVHFNPEIALEAAREVEKVRINPGNFASGNIEAPFLKLLEVCREHRTAIRIGVNHGSLSERILEKFGDSPGGMVESALEYLRICRRENFNQVVVSLKSSNTRIMVYSNRLMKRRMQEENLVYPLHLGVTEAGEGEDGRIRSAAGIGTLLREGMGDTIRVSLTEEPEFEIPVAKQILEVTAGNPEVPAVSQVTSYERRPSQRQGLIGGGQPPVVIARIDRNAQGASGPVGHPAETDRITDHGAGLQETSPEPDLYFVPDHELVGDLPSGGKYILNAEAWMLDDYPEENVYPLFDLPGFLSRQKTSAVLNFILLRPEEVPRAINSLREPDIPCCLIFMHDSGPSGRQAFLELAENRELPHPLLIQAAYREKEAEMFQIRASAELAAYFIDGYADGIWLDNPFADKALPPATAFKILQAGRARMSQTEYIACPSCGRTLFHIQDTLAEVKKATSHLKHLKIAVMGCIVNGPGEMADADYGYVGSGKGKISLYRQRQMVKKNIREEDAVKELVNLIRESGDWHD